MSCYYPRLAVKLGLKLNGSQNIKFLPLRVDFCINDYRRKYGDDLFLLPCGNCLGCQIDKAKDWSTRCVLEAQYHERSSFITLTYDPEHLPLDNRLHREDIDKFLDDLRYRGIKFRYFGCGEYGSLKNSHRPHWHVILFGFMPDDLEFYSIGTDQNYLFTSKMLSSLWSKGFVIVGHVSKQSAGYVARYTTKKIGDDDSFIFMSNRPGIGFQYLKDNAEIIVKTDRVYGDFGDSSYSPVPRYFNRFLMKWFPEEYAQLQRKRLDSVKLTDLNSMINLKTGHIEVLKDNNAKVLDEKLSRIGRM